jgi:2-polyprenyl-3-methyl-5-hydroxy-6-metoxy-1,4-benzoquinol methylase
MKNKIQDKNKLALNESGVRPDFMYKNILDQKRYINVLKFVKGKRILDCACGVGWGSYVMAKAGAEQVVGLDLSSNAIFSAKKYYNFDSIIFLEKNIYNFTSKQKFDVITSFETLEHVDEPLRFLDTLASLSHKNSILFLSTPNGHCFKEENQPPYNPYHKTEFTKDEIFNLLEKSKWYIEEYLGQHPIKKNSREIILYRNFIKKFWKDKIRSETFGILYTLAGKIYRRLLNQKILDPAHLGDCSPKQITKEYEPAYHYLKLRLK